MVKKLLGALVVVVIVLFGAAYTLPREVHVERSIVINRSAATVFPYVNSLQRFNEWSPWRQLDPNVKVTFSGPSEGVGATMAWVGNSKVGKGKQILTESVPDQKVSSELEFGEMGPAKASWVLGGEGPVTTVVWTLDVDLGNNPVGRYFGLLMDKGIGPDYERGLVQLKAAVEKAPETAPAAEAAQPTSSATTSEKAPTS